MRVAMFDGHHLLRRNHHVMEDLTDGEGYPTGGTFGLLTSLGMSIAKLEPTVAVMFWDGGSDPWRRGILPGYRDRKEKNPAKQELAEWHAWAVNYQCDELKKLLALVGIPQIYLPQREADDLIYTAAKVVCDAREIVIISGDKDFLQLVDRRVHVLDPMPKKKGAQGGRLVTPSNFQDVTRCLDTRQYLHYRAMTGDDSDKIPAVKGVGEVTVRKLLMDFGYLNKIIGPCRETILGMGRLARMAVSDEAIETYIRNLVLMDLSKRPQQAEEIHVISKALGTPPAPLQITELDEYAQSKNAFDFSANIAMWASAFEDLRTRFLDAVPS